MVSHRNMIGLRSVNFRFTNDYSEVLLGTFLTLNITKLKRNYKEYNVDFCARNHFPHVQRNLSSSVSYKFPESHSHVTKYTLTKLQSLTNNSKKPQAVKFILFSSTH
jgi:hypothetical protein